MAFGSNIIIANGFDLGKQAPVDSRYLCATIAERDEHVTGNRAYEGMQVYVTEMGRIGWCKNHYYRYW